MGDSAPQDAGNGLDVPQVNKLYVFFFFHCYLVFPPSSFAFY